MGEFSSDAGGEPETPGAEEPSVLGKLPRTRPGMRSPRRDSARAAQVRRTEGTRRAVERIEADRPSLPGVEELARAGIGVATGAVTLGLRIAGRAADTIRGAVERR